MCGSLVPAAFARCSTVSLSGFCIPALRRRQSSGLMTLTLLIDIGLGVGAREDGGAGGRAHACLHARRGEVN